MERDCTHDPEDWNNNESAGDFLGPTHSTDKTTLIISFINNQPFCLFDLILYVPLNKTNIFIVQCFTCSYE